jgi:23S rRNA (cytosine1962-C5)-methyltransferase
LIFEDEHLLVVNKPAGLNTHAPSPYAGEGLYDWLRHREPRWARLAIIHRLDKETSGVIVFSKTPVANRSLTDQFTRRAIHKKYLFLTDRPVPRQPLTVKSALVRVGDKYVSRPLHAGAEAAETRFRLATAGAPKSGITSKAEPGSLELENRTLVEAEPLTGRTHQIRVHAAEKGFPILGDTLYGGTAAKRVYLHAAELVLKHPVSGEEMTFRAPADFEQKATKETKGEDNRAGHPPEARDSVGELLENRLALRVGLIEAELTNAFRLIHGAADGWPGWHVERLGDYLLSESQEPLQPPQRDALEHLMKMLSARGAYHKLLCRRVRKTSPAEVCPRLVLGEPAPERFPVLENGLQFELSFGEGYSVGLFLDQRDNRRRLLTGHIAADFSLIEPTIKNEKPEVLNTFAYTCGFSVCAAKAGARTTSLDLSKKYLEWGRRNFSLNQIDLAGHDFIYGDVFDWLRRLAKKGRRFDVLVLDPPTFSQAKESGVFRVEKDYGKLVEAALPLLKAGGVLFASANAAGWPPEDFMACLEKAIRGAGRKTLQQHYSPQPPDFPVSREEAAYLKAVWARIE